jgi:1-acyl-sn-glycerol-3-phosphate acyltransferase
VAYWVLKSLLSPVFRILWRVQVEGREHIPRVGPVVLAPNHVAFCDSLFVPLAIRRRVTFVAKAEYFDSWKTSWFFRACGQIPMRREGGSASERSLATARQVLTGGGVLGIYPEGTRSPDGRSGAVSRSSPSAWWARRTSNRWGRCSCARSGA